MTAKMSKIFNNINAKYHLDLNDGNYDNVTIINTNVYSKLNAEERTAVQIRYHMCNDKSNRINFVVIGWLVGVLYR